MIEWRGFRAALDQDFAQACDTVLGPDDATWVATSGLRTDAEQAVDYQKGRRPFANMADLMASDPHESIVNPRLVVTEAKPGQSPHNRGLAIDVALLKFDGTLTWDTSYPAWSRLWAAIRASPGLHSGHDFPPIAPADDDHIEAYSWAHSVGGQPPRRTSLEAV